ncbi:MAG TPA: MerR family transcriptional regulator [Acidobacteriaceae bacterium]|jgi:DNA-binding transcriptional MerR regulator|nr:MerR family transcriptional regulator [Acidobacteriaceae bacterium]
MPKHAARRAPREPLIPDKLYFRIGEVAKLCGVETYVLRFWETEFPQMRPNKSGTGQRLYRKRDVELALRVKRLLHNEGYTIAGARQVLTQEAANARAPQLPLIEGGAPSAPVKAKLQRVRAELRDLLSVLSAKPAHLQTHRDEAKSKPRPAGPNLFD